jgi:hypothetical protein
VKELSTWMSPLAGFFAGRATRILEKQNPLQMSQVFSVSAHLSIGGFAFQGFYSQAASSNRRSSQRDLNTLWIPQALRQRMSRQKRHFTTKANDLRHGKDRYNEPTPSATNTAAVLDGG